MPEVREHTKVDGTPALGTTISFVVFDRLIEESAALCQAFISHVNSIELARDDGEALRQALTHLVLSKKLHSVHTWLNLCRAEASGRISVEYVLRYALILADMTTWPIDPPSSGECHDLIRQVTALHDRIVMMHVLMERRLKHIGVLDD